MELTTLTTIIAFVSELVVLFGALIPVFLSLSKITKGTKCQLRSEMLRTYYRHVDKKEIRQYEYENFVALYEAYKALHGNSFIDKIYKEVKTWEVVS